MWTAAAIFGPGPILIGSGGLQRIEGVNVVIVGHGLKDGDCGHVSVASRSTFRLITDILLTSVPR